MDYLLSSGGLTRGYSPLLGKIQYSENVAFGNLNEGLDTYIKYLNKSLSIGYDTALANAEDLIGVDNLEGSDGNSVPSSSDTTYIPVKVLNTEDDVSFNMLGDNKRRISRMSKSKKFILDIVDADGARYAVKMNNDIKVTTLVLAPSPDTLVINSAKRINRYNTMTRWVEEHWGDEIDSITFSGSSFGLIVNSSEDREGGLTTLRRRDTAPYAVLRELAELFRFNGIIYQDAWGYNTGDKLTREFLEQPDNSHFVGNHPRKGLPKERLYIKLDFDYITCIGYIDSFDITEDSSTPYMLKYSVGFKAEKTTWNQSTLKTVADNTAQGPITSDTITPDNVYGSDGTALA